MLNQIFKAEIKIVLSQLIGLIILIEWAPLAEAASLIPSQGKYQSPETNIDARVDFSKLIKIRTLSVISDFKDNGHFLKIYTFTTIYWSIAKELMLNDLKTAIYIRYNLGLSPPHA